MRGVNKVIIVGHLGGDPESKTFSNGGMVCNVSIATSEQWVDKQTGERKEQTEWHRVTFNNRLAEIAQQYLRKGSAVYVEGSLRTRKWQDANGQDRYTTEIRAMNMQMLGGNQAGGMQQQPMAGGGYQNTNQPHQGGFNGGQAPQNNFNQQAQNPVNQGHNNQFNAPVQQPMSQQPSQANDIATTQPPADDDIPF